MTKPATRQIPILKPFMSPDIDKPLLQVLHSSWIGEGEKVKEFEAALMKEFGWQRVLTTNSCTSALVLSLRLAGVERGDVVLCTPATNSATAQAIYQVGATPQWVDIDPQTGRVDPSTLPREQGPIHPKALMVMDWGGVPCELDELMSYCREHDIKLIEDAAHALGAQYKGRCVGGIADFTCFSFQAVKHVTCGDGGAVVCKSIVDHERGRQLRWFGIDRDNPSKQEDLRCEAPIQEFGYKFHMNDIAATIGIENLKKREYIQRTAKENAHFYNDKILDLLDENVKPMAWPTHSLPVFWLYTLRVINKRDEFFRELKAHGVMSSKIHSRCDLHPYAASSISSPLPGVEEFYRTQLSIPVGHWVSTSDRAYIIDAVREAALAAK